MQDVWLKIQEVLSSHPTLEAAHFKDNTSTVRNITELFESDAEQLLFDIRYAVVELCLDIMEATDGKRNATSEQVYAILFS